MSHDSYYISYNMIYEKSYIKDCEFGPSWCPKLSKISGFFHRKIDLESKSVYFYVDVKLSLFKD